MAKKFEDTDKIKVMDIVLAGQLDPFTNTWKVHPYLVWRAFSVNNTKNNNIYAFRITTNLEHEDDYYKVPIIPSELNKLEKVSCVCVDSIFLLNRDKCNLIGTLSMTDFLTVIEARKKTAYLEEVEALKAYKSIVKKVMRSYEKRDKRN